MRMNEDFSSWMAENFKYIDSVTMIDTNGTIIVKKRYNPRFSDAENENHNQLMIGENLLEAFPSLKYDTSSLMQCIHTGQVMCNEAQKVVTREGKITVTNNITFPVISRGSIVGAVELSRDVTHIEEKSKESSQIVLKNPNIRDGSASYFLDDIITMDPKMLEIKEFIKKIASSSSSVLIFGETGTGKELIVSSIHNAGDRRDKPFLAINCAALPETILEGLLFGSQKGAFTGAENKKGIFEEANGGTIYLDEINSMPLILQTKLLRVLQEKSVTPLGSSKQIKLDVRIIASTNTPINELVSSGQMREDILYRLNTISIEIPPLRERIGDLELLADFFIDKYNSAFGKNITGISAEAIDMLKGKPWSGNVREFEHVIESAMNIVEDGMCIEPQDLPAYLAEITEEKQDGSAAENEKIAVSLADAVEAYEKRLIRTALSKSGWKITDAAKILKIPRTSLQYKIDKYNLKRK